MQPNALTLNGFPPRSRPYRVVQWGTGTIGRHALRVVIEHPDLALAGVYVHTQEKVGRDAGELCGLDATGVTATNSIDDIVAVGADCVLYVPLILDLDEVCQLLASGTNVVTTCGHFHHPAGMDPALRAWVEQAREIGRASVNSTGSSPGFISEAIPLVLTSIQRRLHSVSIDEYAGVSQRDSPQLIFDPMGSAALPRRSKNFVPTTFGRASGRRCSRLPRPLAYRWIRYTPAENWPPPVASCASLPANCRRAVSGPADHRGRHTRRASAPVISRYLVLHHTTRAELGHPTDRLACCRRWRCAAGRHDADTGAERPDGRRRTGIHREQGGQSGCRCLRRGPGYPRDHRAAGRVRTPWFAVMLTSTSMT